MADLLVTLREGQSDQRSEACDALGAMGPSAARGAVPGLVALLRDYHCRGRGSAPQALLQIAPEDPAVRAALLETAANDPEPEVRANVAYALADYTSQGVLKEMMPLLLRLLKDKEWSVASQAARAAERLGPDGAGAAPALVELLKRDDSGVRLGAASTLGRIGGEAAKPAVPVLRATLGSSEKYDRASAARVLGELGAIGVEGAPDLIKALADAELVVRLQAAFALGRLGQPASVVAGKDQQLRTAFDLGAVLVKGGTDKASLLKLLEGTKTTDLKLRVLAHDAVEAAGEAAVPGLVAALDSPDDEIRSSAAVALGSMARSLTVRSGPHAEAAVASLAARLTTDTDPVTRGAAGSALKTFASPRALPALLEAIKSKDWDTRADAVTALGGLKNDPASTPAAVAALTAALNDKEPWVRSVAGRTLGEFGPAAKDAVPRLIEMVGNRTSTEVTLPLPRRPLSAEDKEMYDEIHAMTKRGMVLEGIAMTLGKIGPDARAAVPALIVEAKWDRAAIEALGRIGPDAAAAVPVLAELLKDSRLQFYAAPALARIGGTGASALVAGLKDKDARYAAKDALGRGGRGVVAALAAGISDADPEARAAVVQAMSEIGPLAAAEGAPALLKSVEAGDDMSRQVLEAVGQMGAAAIQALNDALTNPSAKVRMVAVQGLMRLGAAAKPALPGLRKIVRGDSDEAVKNAAADALRAIGPGQ
jgi:HEAT repeat protein